jgi:AcrR family transcriptional regulator
VDPVIEGRTDGRLVRGERTRRAILAHAVHVASADGLEGLSLARLGTELAISKSGVFAHFGSKEDLQLATVRAAARLYVERIVAPGLAAPAGLAQVWQLCSLRLDFYRRRDLPGGCFFMAVNAEVASRPGPVRDEVARLQTAWADVHLIALQDAVRNGELHDGTDVEQLWFELDALANRAVLDQQLLSRDAGVARAHRGILNRLHAVSTHPDDLPDD